MRPNDMGCRTARTLLNEVRAGERDGVAYRRSRAGFTLVELLVVVAIIGVLISILLPAMSGARRTAEQMRCSANLRSFAQAFLTRGADSKGFMCSGPSDNRRGESYGAIDEKGWLADMVLGEYAVPGKMLCPTHPATHSQNLALDRLNDDPWKPFTVEDQLRLVKEGFNSNYTLTWYMGYTEPLNIYNGSVDTKNTSGVRGPLRSSDLTRISASRVPLIGDARTDFDNSFDLGDETVRAVKAMTDGPIFDGVKWNRQDYSDLGPAHGAAGTVYGEAQHNRITGNIAFADGHAESFRDDGKRDGIFGFTVQQDPQLGARMIYDELEGDVFGGHISSGDRL